MTTPSGVSQTDAADGPAAADGAADDETLVAAARRDRAAFAALYHRHVDAVFRACWRQLGDREAAEDATALAFERALANLDTFRSGSFKAWLFAIARNAALDGVRAHARRPADPLDAAAPLPDPAPTPEEAAIVGEARRGLRALLADLSPDQRAVVELHLAGLNGREIAEVLGRRHDAVRAIQSRAVARLRELLAAESETVEENRRGHA